MQPLPFFQLSHSTSTSSTLPTMISPYLLSLLVAGVHSFLVPSSIETPDGIDPSLTTLSGEEQISLDCSTCPYALNSERNGGHEWTNDVQSDLQVKIDTDGDSLRLNGVPFYPIRGTIPPQLHVAQTKKPDEDPTFDPYPGDLRLSYSLEYDEKKADDGSSLVSVIMTILALDGEMVKVDNIEIKTIKKADGDLVLHSAVPVPVDPESADAKCGNVLCRVFAKIVTSINKAKAKVKATCYQVKCLCVKCYKSLSGAIKHIHKKPEGETPAPRPTEDDIVKLPTHHKFRPGMFGGHPHHAHHRKGFVHRMGHVMWSTIKIAFMPILIGVAFGMAASAIGMLVGQLVVHLWMKYRKTEQVIYIPIDSDEKFGLPAYEDVPSQEIPVEKEGEENA